MSNNKMNVSQGISCDFSIPKCTVYVTFLFVYKHYSFTQYLVIHFHEFSQSYMLLYCHFSPLDENQHYTNIS